MADGYTQLNLSTIGGGDFMDEEHVTYGGAPTLRKRPRVVLSGTAASSVVEIFNTDPGGSAWRVPVSVLGTVPIPTGAALDATLTGGTARAGSVLTGPNVNQDLSNTTAVQLNGGTSIPVKNGVLVQGLSTNVASVFVGGSGVTTATGYEIQAGQSVPFTCADVNNIYIIGANHTDKVCWNVM